ncbi:L,D-transpeptidase family protein [Neobacillus mesonae]|uniref:L,D-transpeptidase family protein n=1 Tax=Neobacillus mesonae TaxID=1193713 RepID=UPI00203EEBF1|nr:L,D-transpeptidase family protein [Neobacillus mesonae]MCM3567606.1 L,D-transpeptidase family protein [Neobacillus mesonae]
MNKKKIIISSLIVIVVCAAAGMYYHQATRFNANVKINDTKVGGLTADQALKKLKGTVLKNTVYIGEKRILDGKDTKMGFTQEDLSNVEKLLKKQQTFWPSSKEKNYSLVPAKEDQYRSTTMKKQVEEKLTAMNKSLKAPRDAEAHLQEGNIIVSKSKDGKKLDVSQLLKAYQKQKYNSEIHLQPKYIQPVRENSQVVKKEKEKLNELLKQTLDYQVQDKVYTLKAGELIKNASVSKDMKYTINSSGIKERIAEINQSQSTLNKNFTFKTHSGSVITVKGESYGWAIDVDDETKMIKKAFESGEKSVKADNIYGIGWSTYGTGYHTTTNNGIGNTYAEVSIKEQRIWIYKNGKLTVTTPVVTGRHNTHEDTPPGVWYIMYKETPSILEGSEVGNPNYRVKVQYWAPFTNSGCGFHDAGWRTNWASTAFLEHGSGGCVNTPLTAIKTVYNNLEKNEPVIIY